MRPLTEDETRAVFEKLSKFIGTNVKLMIERKDKEIYCFRLQKDRVYYTSEELMKKATNISRDSLACLGTCVGRFTHHKKFHILITCLPLLSELCEFKVWLKPSQEMSFLYGNHILKAGLGRITENTPQNTGVVVYNMAGTPLGFGVTARTTQEARKAGPTDIIVLHQGDVGEYLRFEEQNPACAV
ncbi:hypothetical protein NDN08_001087 [Rhodosorus marinus]|uniref:60S ribosome subunit biogenesis protein NIP7 homolog n=1 Tax=Rhodosorus marinus TaxID=101924 RepID=A0AAV8URB6_9RHOD|nr:hypothetical protein NDN08_001087 [Rhodosorus marinus]